MISTEMERQADNMKISVITPVYHGNRYLDGYMKMMSKAAWEFVEADRDNSVEVILVNDSPEIPIEFNKSLAGGFTIRILENDMNRGIHYSRVNGLNECSGDYVVFLDHDDSISKHCFTSHRNSIGDSDVSVGNGVFEINGQRVPIFANKYSQDYAVREESYIWLRDFIVSPGQCLIKKNSIPEYWKENIIKTDSGKEIYFIHNNPEEGFRSSAKAFWTEDGIGYEAYAAMAFDWEFKHEGVEYLKPFIENIK